MDSLTDRDRTTVLHLDDDEDLLEITKRSLERDHPEMRIETLTDQSAALELVSEVDAIITDYVMDGMDGLEFIEAVREREGDLPVVFFTGRGSQEVAAEAFRLGVTDYLQKSAGSQQYVVLGNRVANLVAKHRAEQAANRAAQRIHRIYDRIGEAYLDVASDWSVTYLNSAAEAILVDGEFEYDQDLWTLLGGANEEVVGELERSMEERKPVSVDCFVPNIDRWLEVRAYPSPSGLSVFAHDVTDEMELEMTREQLDVAESKFRTLREKISRPPRFDH